MTAIEKKSKVKHWKYDFLFVRRELGWGNIPNLNEGKPIRNPFGEPTVRTRRRPATSIITSGRQQALAYPEVHVAGDRVRERA